MPLSASNIVKIRPRLRGGGEYGNSASKVICFVPDRLEQPRQDTKFFYRYDEPNEPNQTKERPLSNVLRESPFTSVSKSGTIHSSPILSTLNFGLLAVHKNAHPEVGEIDGTHRAHIGVEMGGVYLPSQLERTLQLCPRW
jgi:hypothetical protein